MLLTPSPCHKLSHLLEPLPLERDVLYGRPQRRKTNLWKTNPERIAVIYSRSDEGMNDRGKDMRGV